MTRKEGDHVSNDVVSSAGIGDSHHGRRLLGRHRAGSMHLGSAGAVLPPLHAVGGLAGARGAVHEANLGEAYLPSSYTLVWTEPQIWLGGQPDKYREGEMGFPDGCEAVVCLNGGLRRSEKGVRVLSYAFDDAPGAELSAQDTLELVESVALFIGNRPTLWHCTAGVNRSAYMLAAYLMRWAGTGARDTMEHLRELRGHYVLCNHSFSGALVRFEEYLATQPGSGPQE